VLWSWIYIVVNAVVADVLELHGSGTANAQANPSKSYWSNMESLTEEAGVFVRHTHRSIGSLGCITDSWSSLS
jgi:hypothetical protein